MNALRITFFCLIGSLTLSNAASAQDAFKEITGENAYDLSGGELFVSPSESRVEGNSTLFINDAVLTAPGSDGSAMLVLQGGALSGGVGGDSKVVITGNTRIDAPIIIAGGAFIYSDTAAPNAVSGHRPSKYPETPWSEATLPIRMVMG